MFVNALKAVVLRDLQSLAREVEAYPDDETLWRSVPGVANSGGTLALHITGNLRHFVGAKLGGTGYVRDREAEFARRNMTRRELTREIASAVADVEGTFNSLSDADVGCVFPDQIAGRRIDTEIWLVHLVAHLGYHLGQIDYHRRLVTADGRTVDMVAVSQLPMSARA